MDYFEVNLTGFSDFDPEIVIAQLSELGFESFTELEAGLQAYIPEENYQESTIETYLEDISRHHGLKYTVRKIEAQNWNALWESAYEPVTIAGACTVRAPFHQPVPEVKFDIVIEPRMSFGTAHHETTALMLEFLLNEDVAGKRVLDMGCGTGVLAILAYKMNAAEVVAIDTDEWAYSNALDNMVKNNAGAVTVIQGDSSAIPKAGYHLIIANINRNVLLENIAVYSGYLEPSGTLLMSGFYEEDLEQIKSASAAAGLQYASHKSDNRWVGVKFIK